MSQDQSNKDRSQSEDKGQSKTKSNNEFTWLEWACEIQAIAQNGLTYSGNQFDIERYHQLTEIAAQMIAFKTDHEHAHIKEVFDSYSHYATPKMDVRAAIFKDDHVLMVNELDGLWSLPGGWCDINYSPADVIIKEVKEETGFEVKVIKLIALLDKLKHEHPPQIPHSYKSFFLCDITGGELQTSHETSAVQYFPVHDLPPISMHRVTPSQILRCYEHKQDLSLPTDFD